MNAPTVALIDACRHPADFEWAVRHLAAAIERRGFSVAVLDAVADEAVDETADVVLAPRRAGATDVKPSLPLFLVLTTPGDAAIDTIRRLGRVPSGQGARYLAIETPVGIGEALRREYDWRRLASVFLEHTGGQLPVPELTPFTDQRCVGVVRRTYRSNDGANATLVFDQSPGVDGLTHGSILRARSEFSRAATRFAEWIGLEAPEAPVGTPLEPTDHIFDWPRFCVPWGESPILHDGMLAHEDIRLETLREVACLVVLAGPGLGKSVESERLARRERASRFDLSRRDALRNDAISGRVCFDTFDLFPGGAASLPGALESWLERSAVSHLRLFGRPQGWTPRLETVLTRRFARVDVVRLAPLRPTDVETAARAELGERTDAFTREIGRRRLGELAGQPVFLRPLLDAYAQDGEVTLDRLGLYRQSIHFDLERSKARSLLATRSAMPALEHMSWVLVTSDHTRVVTASALTPTTDGELRHHDLAQFIDADLALVEALLGSELFEHGEGGTEAVFTHWSRAEYLAARYAA